MTNATEHGIGQKLLHYQILSELGQGGMSVVYRAKDERLGRDVAIKVLHPMLSNKAEYQSRFAREAKIVAQLQHPHIVQIFDYSGENAANNLFLATELVVGQTLEEFSAANHLSESPELGAMIIWEIANALSHAHEQNVIHRDLKPENIMVRHDGVLKLMDFGIAFGTESASFTQTGALLGSPAHMAPEVIDGKTATAASDIYSLTTVFYCLLTGALPFGGPSTTSVLKAILLGEYTPPEQVSAKVSKSLSNIVARGMALLPTERYQTAKELADDLANALTEMGLPPNSNQLKEILATPKETIPALKRQVIDWCLTEATTYLSKNQSGAAYPLLSRVLAEDPENAEALRLLSGHQKRSSAKKILLFSLLSCLAFVVIFYLVNSSTKIPSPAIQIEQAEIKNDATAIPSDRNSIAQPSVETPKAETPPAKKMVKITVTPFADIYIDGQLVAENSTGINQMLDLGQHSIIFKHRYAATIERSLSLSQNSKEAELHVALERSKPASLIVHTNVDADIAVNGSYRGTTFATKNKPILISLPNRTFQSKVELIVSKEGYQPAVITQNVVAGELSTANVFLEKAR